MRRMRDLLLRFMRVPPRPQPPADDSANVLTFRASPRYFIYKATVWGIRQAMALAGLIVGALFLRTVIVNIPDIDSVLWWGMISLYIVEVFAWGAFLIQLAFTFALLRLDFQMRWYMLSDRSLRIREGTLVVREKTMTYANIQNISIRRNPLQRLFGLATVAARAAGGGKSEEGSHTHEALFVGVDNADEIREILGARIREHRDSGLGDPDDEHTALHAPPALIAARTLLDEARALRASFATEM